jgi:hypothetical protein
MRPPHPAQDPGWPDRAFARRLGRASVLVYMAGPSEKVPQGALAVVVAEDREESEQAKQEVRDSS